MCTDFEKYALKLLSHMVVSNFIIAESVMVEDSSLDAKIFGELIDEAHETIKEVEEFIGEDEGNKKRLRGGKK
jgi:hypothetical protein